MDDGFFARWALGGYPSILTLLSDLCELLGPPADALLLEAVVALLEQGPAGVTGSYAHPRAGPLLS